MAQSFKLQTYIEHFRSMEHDDAPVCTHVSTQPPLELVCTCPCACLCTCLYTCLYTFVCSCVQPCLLTCHCTCLDYAHVLSILIFWTGLCTCQYMSAYLHCRYPLLCREGNTLTWDVPTLACALTALRDPATQAPRLLPKEARLAKNATHEDFKKAVRLATYHAMKALLACYTHVPTVEGLGRAGGC